MNSVSRSTCCHSVPVPADGSPAWKQRSATGPFVATCERCGKVMKRSERTNVFGVDRKAATLASVGQR